MFKIVKDNSKNLWRRKAVRGCASPVKTGLAIVIVSAAKIMNVFRADLRSE
jgi:hypothetical protein